MSFILRLIILILFLVIVEFYFTKKAAGSIKKLFPAISKNKINMTTFWGLVWLNLFPLLLIITWAYAMITQTEGIRQPEFFVYEFFILYPFWIWILIVLQAVLVLVPLDLIKLFFYLIFKKQREKIRSVSTKVVFAIIVVVSLYVPARVIYDLNTISTKVIEYRKENLAEALDGFKITFISDVQADQFTTPRRLQSFIDKVNATNPDLVLIGGDIVTSTPNYLDTSAEYLGKIKSRYGVYSCIGDHDNWMYHREYQRSVDEITEALANVDVKMIDNDKIILDVDSASVGITFITNTYVERIDSTTLDSLANGSRGYDFRIFLTHQPRQYLLDEAIAKNYDMMLAGHTHGGQITLLFPFYNLTPSLFETIYVKGEFWFGNTMLLVNSGLGVSLSPVRYNATPGIDQIVLKRK